MASLLLAFGNGRWEDIPPFARRGAPDEKAIDGSAVDMTLLVKD
jgi:hypothetical protein